MKRADVEATVMGTLVQYGLTTTRGWGSHEIAEAIVDDLAEVMALNLDDEDREG